MKTQSPHQATRRQISFSSSLLCTLLLHLFFPPLSLYAQIDPCGLTWHQINPANSPGHLIGQASAYDSRRQVAVLFGGNNPITGVLYTDGTWELNGATWVNRNPSVHPPTRKDAAMAYDSDRGVCVLFGGGTNIFQHEIPFNDTWEWNGAVWTMRRSNDPSGGNSPPPMDDPIMAYDSFRKRTVLIGSNERAGGKINAALKTWEWDGNVWTVHDQLPTPLPRIGTAMAYDSARRVTVMFGGTAFQGGPLNDTWTWDGTTWKLVATSGTDARNEHAMAFDERRNVMVLFSGVHGAVGLPFIDTSEWNGSSWTEHGVTPQFNIDLPPRRLHKMWYDTREQKIVLFGGTYSNRNLDGSFTHAVLDDLWEARPPGRWVDFNYAGAPSLPETGEFYEPFSTLSEAVNAAPPGCTLLLKSGARAETLTISKPLTLETYNGPVTIGRNSP